MFTKPAPTPWLSFAPSREAEEPLVVLYTAGCKCSDSGANLDKRGPSDRWSAFLERTRCGFVSLVCGKKGLAQKAKLKNGPILRFVIPFQNDHIDMGYHGVLSQNCVILILSRKISKKGHGLHRSVLRRSLRVGCTQKRCGVQEDRPCSRVGTQRGRAAS